MRVTPDNVLLMFYYAVVARQGPHDAWEAGEFLIRVVRRGDDGEWMDEPINDNLWYKVSAPHTGTDEVPAPWVYGRFDATECSFVYKPWSKVAKGYSMTKQSSCTLFVRKISSIKSRYRKKFAVRSACQPDYSIREANYHQLVPDQQQRSQAGC